MWVIGAGVMLGGLVGMVLVGIPAGALIIAAGAAIGLAASWQAERKEQAAKRKLLAQYPPYGY